MKSTSSSKTTVIVIILVVVAAFVYFYFEGGSAPAGVSSLLQGLPSSAGGVGSAELTLLNQIRSLTIDPTLFASPAYTGLQDYSVAIPSENVGRPNPFTPFPGAPTSAVAGH